jgi:uncharacterized membrane protein
MALLILGLIVFLGVHSVRMVAPAWRDLQMQRRGMLVWKGLYSVVSLLGFALIVAGYMHARMEPVVIWQPPLWTRHVAAPLMLLSFIFLAAAYVPGSLIRAKIGHPMLAGVKLWAFAHLIANGTLADIVLFGSFLVWSILQFRTSRRRDRLHGTIFAHLSLTRDILVVVLGVGGAAVFMLFLHEWLIGVRPY